MNETNELSALNHAVEITIFTTLGVVTTLLNLMIILIGFDIYDRAINTSISINIAIANTFASAFLTPVHGQGDTWLLQKGFCADFLTVHAFWRTLCMGLTVFAIVESYRQVHRDYEVLKTASEKNVGEPTHEGETSNRHVNENVRAGKKRRKNMAKSTEKHVDNKYFLNVKLIMFLIWAVSAAISFMTRVSISVTDHTLCSPFQHIRKELVYLFMVFVIIFPFVVMLFLNIKFWRSSVRYARIAAFYIDGESSQTASSSNLKTELRYAKMSFRMFQFLLLSWLPYTVYLLCIMSWGIEVLLFNEIAYKAVKSFQWFSYVSSLFQALIIITKNEQISPLLSKEIRKAVIAVCGENCVKTRDDDERHNGRGLSPSPGLRRKYLENGGYKESSRVARPCHSSSTSNTDMLSTCDTPTSYEEENHLHETYTSHHNNSNEAIARL